MLKTNIISLIIMIVLFTGCENQAPPTKQMNMLLDEAPPVSLMSITLIDNKNFSSERSRTSKKEDVKKFIHLVDNLKIKRVSKGAELRSFLDKFDKKRQNSKSLEFFLLHKDSLEGPNNGFMIEIIKDGSGWIGDFEENKGKRIYRISNGTEETYSRLLEFYQKQGN
ncbi:hypothetical protein [Pontibacillus sp. HMF3514]|uniref:hypothetical protein n=1 Tax=Pontibacillus sp. HMF3514 TaxID=2692425 RepID=UPI00131FFBD3|nr:hypothetical protein [Pontibacillus sp. HMF3514]QHE51535.1 hypothetical protein GS400_05575 [Pontibacillus sp. HMF3514]